MLRSLYSGVSGMKANQIKMDVIGNNIANASTTAFKSGRTRFQDMLSQTKKNAMAPMTSEGGVNPSQVGLGVQLAGIDTIDTQGTLQSTGNNLDVAIDGDGYFMVAKTPDLYDTATPSVTVDRTVGAGTEHQFTVNSGTTDVSYTRDGSFTLDQNGDLLNSDGYKVLGFSLTDGTNHSLDSTSGAAPEVANFVDATGAFTADDTMLKTMMIPKSITNVATGKTAMVTSYSISKDGVISAVLDDGSISAIGQIAMANFKNPEGLTKQGGNLYNQSSNSGVAIVKTGVGNVTDDNSKQYGDVNEGMLEMSNVDLAEQFTDMIVTSRAFQASGKMISTGDEMLQTIIDLKR